ncbi:hypothetical protein N665_1990s0007, partial [Sinapis alba]
IPPETWCDYAKGVGKRLSRKGEAFTLPSGEVCIKILNSVIEKNRKSWEPFVLGQFYSDPPLQGTLHNIVNGIWSKYYRDIAVSKMEGFSFLFRIPNAATRSRVINQRLWQIEGQTMFVDKWEPGIVPLRKVPFQFFNQDGLEHIAGLVGQPKFLHPMTANKTNLEVAKVFTVIDPRKPLPEAVNVQFESGVIRRVLVSSPAGCPQKGRQEAPGRKTRRSKSKDKQKWVEVGPSVGDSSILQPSVSEVPGRTSSYKTPHKEFSQTMVSHDSKLGSKKDQARGETSGIAPPQTALQRRDSSCSRTSKSDVQSDSSDIESSDSDLEEGEFSQHEPDFEVVRYKKSFSGQNGKRGRGPIKN